MTMIVRATLCYVAYYMADDNTWYVVCRMWYAVWCFTIMYQTSQCLMSSKIMLSVTRTVQRPGCARSGSSCPPWTSYAGGGSSWCRCGGSCRPGNMLSDTTLWHKQTNTKGVDGNHDYTHIMSYHIKLRHVMLRQTIGHGILQYHICYPKSYVQVHEAIESAHVVSGINNPSDLPWKRMSCHWVIEW